MRDVTGGGFDVEFSLKVAAVATAVAAIRAVCTRRAEPGFVAFCQVRFTAFRTVRLNNSLQVVSDMRYLHRVCARCPVHVRVCTCNDRRTAIVGILAIVVVLVDATATAAAAPARNPTCATVCGVARVGA